MEDRDPYEAVLLDLRLPNTKQEYESGLAGDVDAGHALMKQIGENYNVTVVIFTNYLSDLDAHHALQSGVIDFFEKKELDDSDGEEKLFARMVYAVGKTHTPCFSSSG